MVIYYMLTKKILACFKKFSVQITAKKKFAWNIWEQTLQCILNETFLKYSYITFNEVRPFELPSEFILSETLPIWPWIQAKAILQNSYEKLGKLDGSKFTML